MSTIDELGAVLDPLHHLEHLGLDGDVEGGGGLVGDEHVGLVGDRHGDHRPLAHAAGELVGVLVGPVRRGRGCRRCRAARRPASRSSALEMPASCTVMASAIWSPTRVHGVEDGQRVLEDHGDALAAERLEVALA